MATTRRLVVPSPAALDQAVRHHLAQGYVLQASGPGFAHLYKAKRFNVFWAVVGTAVCVVPVLVYLLVYLLQQDLLIQVVVVPPQSSGRSAARPST